ncbi:MAG: hypothetical protein KDA33_16805 [Phycisphaerales bacterium]|nr:hypothetical protein [Phycisphaerales bacterium]
MVIAFIGGASPASALVIDFDDLGPSTLGVHMPTLYQGLQWDLSDWHYLSLANEPNNTFLALAGADTFFFSPAGGEDFFFDGADFWSRRAADANGDFYFILIHDGATVYNGLNDPDGRQRFQGTPQLLAPNYTGPVDGIAFAFDGGGDDWDHLAMDNLRIRPVPVTCQLSGDINADLIIDARDIQPFVECVLGDAGDCECADLDASGVADASDLAMFVTTLLTQTP